MSLGCEDEDVQQSTRIRERAMKRSLESVLPVGKRTVSDDTIVTSVEAASYADGRTTLHPIFTEAVKEFTSTAEGKRAFNTSREPSQGFQLWPGHHNLREFTLQIPRTGSVPHPHLTWRQEEENHGVSKKLIAARAPTPWHPRHRRIMTH